MARNVNFDLFRLFLATGIIFFHSFALRGLGFGELDIGAVCVFAFLVVSGFFITTNWLTMTPDRYVLARIGRIVPGFVTCYAVCVLIVPFTVMNAERLSAYFATLPVAETLGRMLLLEPPYLFVYRTVDHTFAGAILTTTVNGPMWTIGFEFLCYCIAPAFALFVRNRVVRLSVWGLLAAGSYLYHQPTEYLPFMFFTGAMLTQIPEMKHAASIAAACAIEIVFIRGFDLILISMFLFCVMDVIRKSKPLSLRYTDISYGTYLYGYPIQHILTDHGLTNPIILFPVSLMLAYAVGYVSFVYLERPAMKYIRNFGAKPAGSESHGIA